MVVTCLSGGAWRTMTTDPSKHMAQPSLPNVPRVSFRKYEPRTDLRVSSVNRTLHIIFAEESYPISTLSAPSGVTRMAGAKA